MGLCDVAEELISRGVDVDNKNSVIILSVFLFSVMPMFNILEFDTSALGKPPWTQ